MPQRRKPADAPQWEPWKPTRWDKPDAAAFQALARGEASPDQQKRALRFLVENIAGYYDISFRPESDRVSAFAEGKRFVGQQVVKLIALNMGAFKDTPSEQG